MDCQEAQECITALLDEELERAKWEPLQEHLKACAVCRSEMELEQAALAVVSKNMPSVPAPAELRSRVEASLNAELERSRKSAIAFSWKTVIALGGALVLLFIVLSITFRQGRSASPEETNFLGQSYAQYEGMSNGSLQVEVLSPDPSAIKSYFASKGKPQVVIPSIKDYRLAGGSLVPAAGERFVHLLYRREGALLSVTQISLAELSGGSMPRLPGEILERVRATGWYEEQLTPARAVALWRVDSVICCAVAELDNHRLKAYLQESE